MYMRRPDAVTAGLLERLDAMKNLAEISEGLVARSPRRPHSGGSCRVPGSLPFRNDCSTTF